MQVAAFLSDLKSLSICPPEAASALVNADDTSKDVEGVSKTGTDVSTDQQQQDSDLQRATELVSLHYGVKQKYLNSGHDPELVSARNTVNSVLVALSRNR